MSVTRAAIACAIACVFGASACDDRPPIRSCADRLDGVWRVEGAAGAEERRYHLLSRERGRGVDLHPLWDTSRLPGGGKAILPTDPEAAKAIDLPVLSPLRIQLGAQRGGSLEGTLSQRVTRGGRTCTVTVPARLSGCADERATFSHVPLPDVMTLDAAACAPSLQDTWISVPLRRE